MNKEIKTDHFKTLEDLLENCKMWINEEDCYAYWRYFEMQCMEEMYKYIVELKKENEKLNHYKLLYQKVKDRNDKAIEYLEQQLEYSKKNCIPARTFTCEKALKILKGNEE